MLATTDLPLHQTGGFQYPDMPRDAGERHGQRRGQVADARITVTQRLQQPTTGRIGQGRVRTVQDLIFNHLVDYSREPWCAEAMLFN